MDNREKALMDLYDQIDGNKQYWGDEVQALILALVEEELVGG